MLSLKIKFICTRCQTGQKNTSKGSLFYLFLKLIFSDNVVYLFYPLSTRIWYFTLILPLSTWIWYFTLILLLSTWIWYFTLVIYYIHDFPEVFFWPVWQRVQINFIFNDNVHICCLSCNIKMSKTTVKLSRYSWSRRRFNHFQWRPLWR
jgi:hypothetical protein